MQSIHLVLGRPLGSLSRGCNQQDLPHQSFCGHSGHRAEPTYSWDLSTRRSGSTFRTLQISKLRTLPLSVTPCTLRKISSTPLVLLGALFQSLPRFIIIVEDGNKDHFENWQLGSVWKFSFWDHKAIKLTQNSVCFINPCIFKLRVPSFATCEYHRKVLQLHPLQRIATYLQHTLPWVSVEMGVGRGWKGALVPLEFWNLTFSYYVFSKKRLFS